MFRKVSAILVIVITIAMFLGACAPAATPAPAAQPTQATAATQASAAVEKPFKLGVVGPFSGPSARTGAEFKAGAEMAFEAINYKIGNYKIELVWIDSQSDPAKASQAYEQAVVQDKIQAGILNWHSSVAVALMDLAAKYKIPHFFGFGATELINEKYASDPQKYSYWMGKTWPSPSKLSIAYVVALEDAIKAGSFKPKDPANKTAYVWGEDNDWGRSFGKAVKQQLVDAGWKIVGEDYVPLDQTEFYPFLTKVKGLDPDILVGTSGVPPLVSALIKQHSELGVRALLIDDGLGWVGEWYDLTGKSSNYVVDQIPQFASEKAQKWAADFKAKYGIDPSPSAGGQVFDMTNFFIKIANTAIETYGEMTSETLYKTGQDLLWTGKLVYTEGLIHTRYEYNKDSIPDPVVGKGYFIFPVLQYMDGKSIIVWPPDVAVGTLQSKPLK